MSGEDTRQDRGEYEEYYDFIILSKSQGQEYDNK